MPAATAATSDELGRRRARACGTARVAFVEFLRGHAVWVVSACIATAVAMNVFAPFWTACTVGAHEQTTSGRWPVADDRPTFPVGVGNVAYVVVNSSATQGQTDTYLDTLAERLRSAAPAGVRSVVSQSADPLTAPIAHSDDNRVAYINVELNGAPGNVEAVRAVRAVRAIVRALPVPAGVQPYVSGPGAASAAAATKAGAESPWIALIVFGAMLVLVILIARCKATSAMVLASAAAALLIALPVDALFASPAVSPTGAALTVALTMGAALHYARLMRKDYRQQRRRGLSGDAAVAEACRSSAPAVIASASILVFSLAVVTIVDSAQLLGVGISAAAGVAVVVLLCYACATVWMRRVDAADHTRLTPIAARRLSQRLTVTIYRHAKAALALAAVIVVAGITQLPRIDAVLAHPQVAPVNSEAALGYAVVGAHFADDRLRPMSIVVRADHDLRNPRGLLAIARVTRRLMELPAATRVQSAASPGGVPWPQATVAHQISELNNQMQSEGLSAAPFVDPLLRLPATMDELTSEIDQLQRDLSTATARISSASTSLGSLRSLTDRSEAALGAVSGVADPLRRFIADNHDCAADRVCSPTRQVVQLFDEMLADTRNTLAGANTLSDTVSTTRRFLTSTSSKLSRVRAELDKFRPLVDEAVTHTRESMPEAAKTTSFINTMTADLSNSGDGGFYLSQSQIDAASYDRIRARMFSADGRATRIFVYISGISPGDQDLARSAASAVGQATKYGALAGTAVEIETVGVVRLHGVSDLAVPAILLATVIALATSLALRSIVAGVGLACATLACVAAGLGGATSLAATMPGRTDWSTPLLALVVALPVVAEDGFRLVGRWVGRRRGDGTTRTLSSYAPGPVLVIAALIWAATVTGATVLTAAGFDYVGAAVMCCLAVSYLCLRSCLIAASR